jgi:predicted secreted hydrolase
MLTINFYYLIILHGLFIHADPSIESDSLLNIDNQKGDAKNTTNLCDQIPEGFIKLPEDDSVHENMTEWWFGFGNLQDDQGRNIDYVFVIPKFFVSGNPFLLGESGIYIDGDLDYKISTHRTPIPKIENGYDFDLGHVRLEGGNGTDAIYLRAGSYSLDIQVTQTKAPMLYLHSGYLDTYLGGDSYYYSRPRSITKGTLTDGDKVYEVSGISYFDHQYGLLEPLVRQTWDWFLLHLDDGTDIQISLSRPGISEVWISDQNCNNERLDGHEIEINIIAKWPSPVTGCSYPQGWEFTIKGKKYVLTPVNSNNEWNHPYRIRWEGPVVISGDGEGRGIAQLVGYCHR